MITTAYTRSGLPVRVLKWSGDEQEILDFCGSLFSHVDSTGRARVKIPPLGADACGWVPQDGYVVISDEPGLYPLFFMPGSKWMPILFTEYYP